MAREFTAASDQYLETASTPINTLPLSLACWVRFDNVSNYRVVGGITDASISTGYIFQLDTGGALRAKYDNIQITSSATVGTGQWYHYGMYFDSSNYGGYLDGANNWQSETGAADQTGADRVSIGKAYGFDASAYNHDGGICHFAIWNVVLSAADFATLAAGFSPLFVQPDNLVFYAPLTRDEDADFIGGLSFTAYNTPTVSPGPALLNPAAPQIITAPAPSLINTALRRQSVINMLLPWRGVPLPSVD